MGVVTPLPTRATVEAAWDRMRALAAPLADNPRLLADRQHMENLARAEHTWKQAFVAWDGR